MELPARSAARLLHLLPRERISRAVGTLTQARVPRRVLQPVLDLYSRAYRVDLDEAVLPPDGFASFNDFFTRRLRDGLRPIDDGAATLVSPADGRLDDLGPIDAGRAFRIKGQSYDVPTLLGSTDDAAPFADGSYAIVYLSPRDYHRVHTPVAGRVAKVRHIPGSLFPVNAFGVKHVPQLFARNERVVVMVENETWGRVAVVLVGAMIVGRIDLAFDAPPRPEHGGRVAERTYDPDHAPVLAKGDEIGAFLLGSTVVVLVPASARGAWRDGITGRAVRMGETLARRGHA